MNATWEMVAYLKQQRDRWLRAAVLAEGMGRQDASNKWFVFAHDYEADVNAEMRALTGRTS